MTTPHPGTPLAPGHDLTALLDSWSPPDSLPSHYTDRGEWCSQGGQPPDPQTGRCPRGCDHADHYANDGHEACEDNPVIPPRGGADEAYRVMLRGVHLGTVSRHGRRWEATAGGNALYIPPPAEYRVTATMAVLDNAHRCGILTGPATGLSFEAVQR